MHAIVHDRYGTPDVLSLTDVDRPAIADDEVLVRVRAASVNALDSHLMRGTPYIIRLTDGFRRPKRRVAGVDLAGVVEAVGKDVTEFQTGDEVFGQRGGAFAEYVNGRGRGLVKKPANLGFEAAAAIPVAASTALQAIRDKARVEPGQQVLVIGAGGGVGTFAVQIAKDYGAHVTAVTSTANIELVRSIGADRVIDYERGDFASGAARYDAILDIGGLRSMGDLRRILTPTGSIVIVGAPDGKVRPLTRLGGAVVRSRILRQRVIPFLAQITKDDLMLLGEMAASGRITPVIDRTYPLAEAADAMRRLESGKARGKVVITI